MSRLNSPIAVERKATHEGAPAYQHVTAEQQLRRSVLSCLLWESEFYEDGQSIADRIAEYAGKVPVSALADLAVEARSSFNLRHVPLLLLSVLARRGSGSSIVSDTIEKTIQRADELAEFLAVYAKFNGVAPNAVKPKMSAQVKKGLARAFCGFNEYELAKWSRDGAIKMRDVLFLVHASPKDEAQAALWKRLVANELATPDTWEVALATGGDKKETFERLIRENALGYMALLRNLRNMQQAGCDEKLVHAAILARKGAHRVLPFRFVASARAVPQWERVIDEALCASLEEVEPLPGKTAILVDVSASMYMAKISEKSELTRADAAATLASIIPGDVRVFTFSSDIKEVPPRRGMAGVDAIHNSQGHGNTRLGHAVAHINEKVQHDRLIVLTDEQSEDRVPNPVSKKAYMINVASARNGVGYGPWVHVDGFSETVIRYIAEIEKA